MTQRDLANKLRRARRSSGLTQGEVAQRLGVHRVTITQIEKGVRAVSALELSRLAHIYGKYVASFFDESFETDRTVIYCSIPFC